MARLDLLALTFDDLVTLSNRGIAKRATQEAQDMKAEVMEEVSGVVQVIWDDAICRLPVGVTLAQAECTCTSIGMCRHIIRSVLAYQARAPRDEAKDDGSDAPSEAAASLPTKPWDPGAISDEQLERLYHKNTLKRARTEFERGQVLELVRSAKPLATVHSMSCTLRFLVPGDPNYTHCDCAEPAPCSHVPLAVWAFRLLDPAKEAGLVTTHRDPPSIPVDTMDAIEKTLSEIAVIGLANLPSPILERLRRQGEDLRKASLIWPAEIVGDIILQAQSYQTHDARFDPRRFCDLWSELHVRFDAIRSDTGAIPQLFVRGTASDRTTEVGSARLIGLGSMVHSRTGVTEVESYLQDMDSGLVVAIQRTFNDPDPASVDEPRSFNKLGQFPVAKGVSLSSLAEGQMLIKGGKRTARCEFFIGRSPATFNPQSYQWERLRPPLLVENLEELNARLETRPPQCLMPRRVGSNLFVLPVAKVEACTFSDEYQELQALVADDTGRQALLIHPYFSRGAEGLNATNSLLQSSESSLKFVAGEFHRTAACMVIRPISLIFEKDGHRFMHQPWLSKSDHTNAGPTNAGQVSIAHDAPWTAYLSRLSAEISELLLLGIDASSDLTVRQWADLAEQAQKAGLKNIAVLVEAVTGALDEKRRSPTSNSSKAASALADLAVVVLTAMM
jgi:hypothetical protein